MLKNVPVKQAAGRYEMMQKQYKKKLRKKCVKALFVRKILRNRFLLARPFCNKSSCTKQLVMNTLVRTLVFCVSKKRNWKCVTILIIETGFIQY